LAASPFSLPKTASPHPAIGLIGLMSLGLGVGLRVFNRRLRVCNAQRSRPTLDGVGREWVSIYFGFTNNPIKPAEPFACDIPPAGTSFARNSSRVSPGGSSFGSKSVATTTNV
jgi:hypothetical protein